MARGTAKSDWTVAFDRVARKHVPWAGWDRPEYEYLPADTTFLDDLTFLDYSRGRSSVTVQMQGTDGKVWSMFLAEFMSLVEYLQNGTVGGTWGFVKNGSNTGIVRLSG